MNSANYSKPPACATTRAAKIKATRWPSRGSIRIGCSPFPLPRFPRTLSSTDTAASQPIEEILPRARKLQRPAVELLLRAHYRRVYRIACALCGDDDAGKSIVKTVMNQSLRALPHWRGEAQATNWFLHHTILRTREFVPWPNQAGSDPLLRRLIHPSPQYVAFLRAVRNLPPQQREAFLLFRGEKLDTRQVAVAMDCSTTAAANRGKVRPTSDQRSPRSGSSANPARSGPTMQPSTLTA